MAHKHFVDGTGFVSLVDYMPRENLDKSIVDAARVSYDPGSTTHTSTDRGLIRYLMRHWHTTPFEMVDFKFHIKMPLFVARQHLRHRTASVNEVSARYSEVKDEFFVPDEFRQQAKVNRQGSEGVVETNEDICDTVKQHNEVCHKAYLDMINDEGVCREQARMILPQSMYTEFYWKINLHNLMHYLHLRMEGHAQKEIQDYAKMIYKIVKPLAPYTFEAFEDFRVHAVQFSHAEQKVLAKMIQSTDIDTDGLSKGEAREFREKIHNIVNVHDSL
jgi:thymidylate synthase (FAD)